MACHYQEWDRERHELGYCGKDAISGSSLCQEHTEWVADCKAPEVSKLNMKYPYKLPKRKSVKLAPSTVVETILEAGTYAKAYKKHEDTMGNQAMTYPVWFAQAIIPKAKAPEWTTPEQAKERDAKEFSAYAEQKAERKALEDSPKVKAQYAKSQADMEARSARKLAELERMKANDIASHASNELEIFGRFLVLKPVAPNASACAYFDRETGIKLAITLEGVRRMGPQVVNRIVSARMGR